MKKPVKRAYIRLPNNNYAKVESELNTYVATIIFGRGLTINEVSYLDWDLYVFSLPDSSEENIWDVYSISKAADLYSDKVFLIVDQKTWSLFLDPTKNMVLMDRPDWVGQVLRRLENV